MQELIQQFQTIMYVSETVPVSCAMTYEINMLFSHTILTHAINNALAELNFTLALAKQTIS